MNKSIKYLLPATLAVVLLISCEKDYFQPIEVPETDTISFKTDLIPIFSTNCLGSGCHEGSVAPDLTEANAYESLISTMMVDTLNPEKSILYIKMTTNMPPSGKLSQDKINMVLLWIKQGALDN